MRIKSVDILNSPVLLTIAGDRYFRIEKPIEIEVTTNRLKILYSLEPGYVTDFRSGGPLIDFFIKQFGTDLMQAAYICHDIAYTPLFTEDGTRVHVINKRFADSLLEQMLVYAQVQKWKAKIVHFVLYLFGRKSYVKDNDFSVENSTKCSVCFTRK